MTDQDYLLDELRNFYGTEHYYRYVKPLLVTDGVKFLADNAHCYWLLDMVWSYLPALRKSGDTFFVVVLTKDGVETPLCRVLHPGRRAPEQDLCHPSGGVHGLPARRDRAVPVGNRGRVRPHAALGVLIMPKFVTMMLNAQSSTALIDALAGSDEPVGFVFRDDNGLILNAYIDGAETPHQLVLYRDGSWRMRTCLEV